MFNFINSYKTAIRELVGNHQYLEAAASLVLFPFMWMGAVITGQTVTAAAPQTTPTCNDNLDGKVTTETYTYEDKDGNTVTVTSTTTWGKEEYLHPEAFDLLADAVSSRIEKEMKK